MANNLELHQSSLSTYLMCPKRFYYKYIQRFETPAPGAAFVGSAFHYAVSRGLKLVRENKRDELTPEFMEAVITEELETGENYAKTSPGWNGEIQWESPKEREIETTRALAAQAAEHLRVLHPVMIEQYIRIEIESTFCGGTIDGFDADVGLLEFKTSKRPWSMDRIHKNLQLTFYFMLLKSWGPAQMHIAVKSSKDYQVWNTQRNKTQIDYLKYEIISPVVLQIQQGNFPCCDPTSWWCSEKWCPQAIFI